jgi:hypothetical protein
MKHEGVKDVLALEKVYLELFYRYIDVKTEIKEFWDLVKLEGMMEPSPGSIPSYIEELKSMCELGDKSEYISHELNRLSIVENIIAKYE